MIKAKKESKKADKKIQVYTKPVIVKGTTIEGMDWIIVYQFGKAEIRCLNIQEWIDVDVAKTIERCSNISFHDIFEIIN